MAAVNSMTENMGSEETIKFFFKLLDMGKFTADELLPKFLVKASPQTLADIIKASDDASISFQCLSKFCRLIEKGSFGSVVGDNRKTASVEKGAFGSVVGDNRKTETVESGGHPKQRRHSKASVCSEQEKPRTKTVNRDTNKKLVKFMGLTICSTYSDLCSNWNTNQSCVYCLPCGQYFVKEVDWIDHCKFVSHIAKVNSPKFQNAACLCTRCNFVTISSQNMSVSYTKYHSYVCHQIEPNEFVPVKDFRIVVDRNKKKTFRDFFPKDGVIITRDDDHQGAKFNSRESRYNDDQVAELNSPISSPDTKSSTSYRVAKRLVDVNDDRTGWTSDEGE